MIEHLGAEGTLVYNFDPEELRAREPGVAEQFRTAEPFRHFAIDDFVSPEVIVAINDEFIEVAARRVRWQRFSTKAEVKFAWPT